MESSQKFADLHKIPKFYDNYESLARDPDVEVVYIGTINPQHYPLGKLMLEHGKHVLIEKPLTMNLKQTKELIKIAREKKLFLMEAIWSRFFPLYQFMMETIRQGTIGDVKYIKSAFGIPIETVDRIAEKELGGGTILDLGIYTINVFAMIYKGLQPLKIAAVGHLNKNGITYIELNH